MRKLALVASLLVTLLAVTACHDTREPTAPNQNQPQRTPQNPNQPSPDQR